MVDILVSFCNVKILGAPTLGLLDATTSVFRIIQLPTELSWCTGITGLGQSARYIYAAVQTPPSLLILDRADLALRNYYVFHSIKDVHSIWVSDEALYAVSTGTDEVVRLPMQDTKVISETVFWSPDTSAPRSDIHHLNGIYGWRNELVVAGHGKKHGALWSSAKNGFIVNISRGEEIAPGIYHPHSPIPIDGKIAYCESPKMAVRVVADTRTQQLPGYTRGLCLAGEQVFAGTSIRRKVSKSTGIINPDYSDSTVGQCAVSRLSVDDFDIEETTDLSAYGREIYDLLPVEGTSKWPLLTDPSSCDVMATLMPVGAAFIFIDEDQWETHKIMPGRHRIPFLECNGQYVGLPTDDETAIRELDRSRQQFGVDFIIFGWIAFWWLDYYSRFHCYLRSKFPCVLENSRLKVFDLRE